MKRAAAALTAALSYFTILPVPAQTLPDGFAVSFLPFLGLGVGALAGAAGYGVFALTHSAAWCAIAAWIVSIAATGAIHLDGFLDCCDGVFATASIERRLQILRDPHHGTYAIAGMAMLTVVWVAGIAAIPPPFIVPVLVVAESVARFGAVLNAAFHGDARGRERLYIHSGVMTATGIAIALCAWWISPWAAALAVGVVLFELAAGAWMARRLNGLTGDVYGALVCAGIAVSVPLLAAMLRSPLR